MKWLESAVSQVLSQLEQKDPATYRDIYVWSDGRVTGPKETENEGDPIHVVSVFTPGERPTADEVRQSIQNGMATVPEPEFDADVRGNDVPSGSDSGERQPRG